MSNKFKHSNYTAEKLREKALLDVGTDVQFIEFNFDTLIIWTQVLALVILILFTFTMISNSVLLTMFFSSAATMFAFYIKYGTN